MNRFSAGLQWLVIALLGLLAPQLPAQQVAPKQRPNVLLIVADGYQPTFIREAPAEGETHSIEQGAIIYLFAETPVSELTAEHQAILFGESELPQKDTEGVCKIPTGYLGDFQVKEVAGESITLEPVSRI